MSGKYKAQDLPDFFMRAVASKIDNSLHEALVRKCGEKGCSPSEYIRDLVKRDIENTSAQQDGPASKAILDVAKKYRVKIILDDNGNVLSKEVIEDTESIPKAYNVKVIHDDKGREIAIGRVRHA
jgi:hypothetical protein